MLDHVDSPDRVSDTAQTTEPPSIRGLIGSICHHLVGRRTTAPVARRLTSLDGAAIRFNSGPRIPEQACRSVEFQFQARDHASALGPAVGGAPDIYQVSFDGRLADDAISVYVDRGWWGNNDDRRIDELSRPPGTVATLFEIEFDEAEVERYSVTSG